LDAEASNIEPSGTGRAPMILSIDLDQFVSIGDSSVCTQQTLMAMEPNPRAALFSHGDV
jgi:hypothetical protein